MYTEDQTTAAPEETTAPETTAAPEETTTPETTTAPEESEEINYVKYDPKNRLVVMTKKDNKITVHKKATGKLKEFVLEEFEAAVSYFNFLQSCSQNQ